MVFGEYVYSNVNKSHIIEAVAASFAQVHQATSLAQGSRLQGQYLAPFEERRLLRTLALIELVLKMLSLGARAESNDSRRASSWSSEAAAISIAAGSRSLRLFIDSPKALWTDRVRFGETSVLSAGDDGSAVGIVFERKDDVEETQLSQYDLFTQLIFLLREIIQ